MSLPPWASLKGPLPASVPPAMPFSGRNTLRSPPRVNPFRASAVAPPWVEVAGASLQSTLAQEELRSLVTEMEPGELLKWFRMIFGEDIPQTAIQRLCTDVRNGALPEPRIILVRDELQGHPAAYHGKLRTILIWHELAQEARGDNDEAWKLLVCLTEEFGHHVDQLLRTHYSSVGGDARLDEGARMAYSLVDFGFNRGQKSRVFAQHTTAEGSVALQVEYAGMTAAVQRYLSLEEQRSDGRSGDLEFFGAGRGSGRPGSFGHESIEDSLEKAGFDVTDRHAVYFGNWMRDHSQIIDPKLVRKKGAPVTTGLARETLTAIVDIMAREKFGNAKVQDTPVFKVDTARLGVYRNEEHIDNPKGMTDARSIDSAFRGACRAEELAVNALGMKNFIRTGGMSGGRAPSTYHVKDGDSLDSVARAHGLTWQQLARFNFGTDVPAKINEQLYSKVGCRKKTRDGRNYIFTSKDSPGLLQIPGVTGGLVPEASYSAFHYLSGQLRQAVKVGRSSTGFRHFGNALHTLEDFFSHTNFVELLLIQLGAWVEPWVPVRGGAKAGHSSPLVLTSGQFGGLDTMASLTLGIAETMQKEHECIAGEMTTGSKIILILLDDQGYTTVRDTMGGMLGLLHELEKKYPAIATLSCETVGVVTRFIKAMLGGVVHSAASLIDDAQTAFLSDASSTDPTHTQLAKDHDDHPLHDLAAHLAKGAVLDVGKALQQAWRGKATADEVVLTASRYFLHPAHLELQGSAAWMRDRVNAWIPGHRADIARLGSRSWVTEWSKHSSQELKQMMNRAATFMGKGK